ncbi:MAG: L,D-transpeptidase family protein [Polyangiaceae bacterium]
MKPGKRLWLRGLLGFLAGIVAVTAYGTWGMRPGVVSCAGFEAPTVVVETASHTLALCEGGATAGAYRVRLGKHGTGKTREGDEKTPLGRYSLGGPRGSIPFATFIPIAYPTPAQKNLGYTGSAVGVHGPDRRVKWVGPLVNAFDTTDGCVGIATDREMEAIASWVRERKPKEIVLR